MLGRGLESLIPDKSQESNSSPTPKPQSKPQVNSETSVFHIEVNKIKPNPHQPRKNFDEESLNELAASIRELGVIQPLIVSKVEIETELGTQIEYQLIAGERRLKASKIAGLERVPAIVRRIADEKDKLELAIVENVQRSDLNPIEAARSYAKLQEEFGLTQREVAARVGKSRETISNVLRLLNLPSYIQDAVSEKKISDSQGRLLLAVNDSQQQQNLFNEIIRNNLSVRELKNRIGNIRKPAAENKPDSLSSQNPEFTIFEERLQEVLGTKVSLQKTTDGGKIMISFFSPEEFQSIINKILSSPNEPDDRQLI
ncbi:TPA: chromosome partitioning protein ParB [Patescibacteria group bacterium]|jgi:ParB family chromosome partitioning protein|nr:chromosome partitioning protein ParB [Patescibacteria group bacterium]|tara:strand:+ start:2211 stop:3152 length:942 start_codon:yes stop_codon:yes gene_type:complete